MQDALYDSYFLIYLHLLLYTYPLLNANFTFAYCLLKIINIIFSNHIIFSFGLFTKYRIFN